MPHVTASDGVSLHYAVHGSGPHDVFLVHGMGTSTVWEPMLERIDRAALRVVTSDLRGHGRSSGDDRNFDYPQLDADLLAIADAAGCQRAVVAGFSGGCKNAAWLAALHPERVRGLLLVAPPGLGVVPVPSAVVAAFVDALERTGDLPAEFDSWFTERIGPRRAIVIRGLATTPRPMLEATVRLWVGTSVAETAAKFSGPTVVVAGAREALYDPAFQRQTTLATLPHATMEILDCSHFIPCEEPQALAGVLERFVTSLAP